MSEADVQCWLYGGPKGHAMRQYLSDNVYAPIDNIYTKTSTL